MLYKLGLEGDNTYRLYTLVYIHYIHYILPLCPRNIQKLSYGLQHPIIIFHRLKVNIFHHISVKKRGSRNVEEQNVLIVYKPP